MGCHLSLRHPQCGMCSEFGFSNCVYIGHRSDVIPGVWLLVNWLNSLLSASPHSIESCVHQLQQTFLTLSPLFSTQRCLSLATKLRDCIHIPAPFIAQVPQGTTRPGLNQQRVWLCLFEIRDLGGKMWRTSKQIAVVTHKYSLFSFIGRLAACSLPLHLALAMWPEVWANGDVSRIVWVFPLEEKCGWYPYQQKAVNKSASVLEEEDLVREDITKGKFKRKHFLGLF